MSELQDAKIERARRLSWAFENGPLFPIGKGIEDPFSLFFNMLLKEEKEGRTQPMYGPRVIQLPRDLADGEPLHELSVFKDADGKTFATLTLELKADGEYATNPVDGLYPDGHPEHGAPSHVYIPGPTQPRLLIARSVPTLPAPEPAAVDGPPDVGEEATATEEEAAPLEAEAEVPDEIPAPRRRSTRG